MRNSRKVLLGTVISNKMQKTITVVMRYYTKDVLYDKKIRKESKFHVHDEKEIAQIGDLVSFMSTRPLSKTKNFRLLKIISKKKVN
ncbi:30S ribosomal protein S17 [Candidatus Phytoplasma pini]|uniref:Small ribosomal subunit protein uS17 n=1 Tax=Candidatus Phytoplasma pini TaxID=267362 RepID=A0A559KJP8_9MOLU|nr:30S ribosomal protein S17 [Candidatus Phytoplasma pini]TVY12350.1 30S ribosomal protein S17 [Candidatus Phytoplasma pini]